MPNNSQNQVIDPILSKVALGYRHPEHVGSFLFPIVPVNSSGGKIIQFDKSSFRLYNTKRAPGTKAKRAVFGHEGLPYALENHALDAVVPRERMRDASQVPNINLATRAVNLVLKSGSLVLESQQASIATNLANYSANNKVTLAGTDQWSDYANSNPSKDTKAGKEAIRSAIGVYPNIMEISALVFSVLQEHPLILDRFKYTSSDSVTEDMLARYFDVEKVVVGKAIAFNDDDTTNDLWGKDVVLSYSPQDSSGAEEPSAGYTYQMEGHPLVEMPHWDEDARSYVYGMTHERAAVQTGMNAAFLIKNAVE